MARSILVCLRRLTAGASQRIVQMWVCHLHRWRWASSSGSDRSVKIITSSYSCHGAPHASSRCWTAASTRAARRGTPSASCAPSPGVAVTFRTGASTRPSGQTDCHCRTERSTRRLPGQRRWRREMILWSRLPPCRGVKSTTSSASVSAAPAATRPFVEMPSTR